MRNSFQNPSYYFLSVCHFLSNFSKVLLWAAHFLASHPVQSIFRQWFLTFDWEALSEAAECPGRWKELKDTPGQPCSSLFLRAHKGANEEENIIITSFWLSWLGTLPFFVSTTYYYCFHYSYWVVNEILGHLTFRLMSVNWENMRDQ